MNNPYLRAAQVLDKLYREMPEEAFMDKAIENERFNRFQKMFSEKSLASINGYDIWKKIFDIGEKGSLLNILSSRKSGYYEFGSITAASVNIYPIYKTKENGWNRKGKTGISYQEAMKAGADYRDKLIKAIRLIEHSRFDSIEGYETFESALSRIFGDDAKYIWIHKFFHMMYPEFFSEFHSDDWKTHFLCAMQILPRDSFYGKAGQIAEIRRHMNLKDYYRIANVVYEFFPEISKGGICRLSLSKQGKDSTHNWEPGKKTYILPTDYNDKLLDIKWFTNASEKDGNNLFVVMDDADELCGVFSRLEGEPSDKQSFKIGRKAVWHRCFQEHNRLPVPEDGKTIKDRTIKDPRNLIYVYKHYYSYFDVNNDLEKVFESYRKQFESEAAQFDSERIKITEKYPVRFTQLKSLKIEQLVYGYEGSLLTMLYDNFTNLDNIRTQDIRDIGFIYSDGEKRGYDNSLFSSETEAFERLLQEIILLLCIYAGNEGSDDQILKSPLSNNLKVKLLSIYYPEKYIGIYDIDELDYILGMLDIPFTNKDSWIQKNHLLINWKNSHIPFAKSNISNFVFLKTICEWLEIPFSQGILMRDSLKLFPNDLFEKKPAQENLNTITQPTGNNVVGRGLPPIESEPVLRKDRAKAGKTTEIDSVDIRHTKQKTFPPVDAGVVKQNEIEEAIEQLTIADETVAEDFDFTYAGIPQDKKEYGEFTTRKVIPRDIQKKKNALAHAGYKCEYNEKHQSFLSRASGLPYMEAHHLIPMEYYDRFDVSIDIEENIVSLCPNCHREIHHGKDASVIVKKIYEQRKPYLWKAGIDISLNQLLVWYNCKHEPV